MDLGEAIRKLKDIGYSFTSFDGIETNIDDVILEFQEDGTKKVIIKIIKEN